MPYRSSVIQLCYYLNSPPTTFILRHSQVILTSFLILQAYPQLKALAVSSA